MTDEYDANKAGEHEEEPEKMTQVRVAFFNVCVH